ncbi:MAG TPA: IS66 family transposase, partial [Prosthecobacter sp.]|nr:IS66 family transposase [Prosthecobacter sp.]
MPAAVREVIQSLEAENARLSQLLKLREEEIRLLNLRLWGPKADKLSDSQLALLPLEPIVTAAEVKQEAEQPEEAKELAHAKKPRLNHPGREQLPAHLERREVIIPCHPKDCTCLTCGGERPIIGYEVREELDCVPAQFFVKVTKREKRGAHCQGDQGVAVAPSPVQIVPKSKLSNDFVIMLLVSKFQQHQPIYRICAMLLENYHIDLSRQTLGQVMLRAAELLIAVVNAMKSELLAGDYIQADETTVPCQSPDVRGRNHRAYLWEYSRPGENVVFQFEMGRGRAGPKEFLRGFRGILQCDGYKAYDDLGDGIRYLACMAHIRREFVEANHLAPEDPLPRELVQKFEELYAIGRSAKKDGLTAEAR